MKERPHESPTRVGLRADDASSGAVEKSPEGRGLSQTMRDPARRKRNAKGIARESSSLTESPNGAKANGKRNGRETPGASLAASDDASGTTPAGDAGPPSSAACSSRDACAEVAAPRSCATPDEKSGTEMNRRPRPSDDLENEGTKLVPGIGDPLAMDAPGFVDEMHARANLYEIGKEFLQTADLKLKQRTWEYLLEMKYGRGAPVAVEEVPRIDVELPRPQQ